LKRIGEEIEECKQVHVQDGARYNGKERQEQKTSKEKVRELAQQWSQLEEEAAQLAKIRAELLKDVPKEWREPDSTVSASRLMIASPQQAEKIEKINALNVDIERVHDQRNELQREAERLMGKYFEENSKGFLQINEALVQKWAHEHTLICNRIKEDRKLLEGLRQELESLGGYETGVQTPIRKFKLMN